MPSIANHVAALTIGCSILFGAQDLRAQSVETCYLTRAEVEAALGAQIRDEPPLERAQPNGSAFCTFAIRRVLRDSRYRILFVRIDVHANERQARARGVRWMSGTGEIPRVAVANLGDEAWYGGMTAFRKGSTIVVVNATGDLVANVSGARDREIEERLARLIGARLP